MAHELSWRKRIQEKRQYARSQALKFTLPTLRSPLPAGPLNASISRLHEAYPNDTHRVRNIQCLLSKYHFIWFIIETSNARIPVCCLCIFSGVFLSHFDGSRMDYLHMKTVKHMMQYTSSRNFEILWA